MMTTMFHTVKHRLLPVIVMVFMIGAAQAATSILEIPANTTTNLPSAAYGSSKDNSIILAGSGSTLVLPNGSGNVVFYPHLIVSGGVVRISSSGWARCRFVSGIRAVDGGSLVIDGIPEITVDRASVDTSKMLMPPTGPICDIGDVTFTDSNAKGLLLRLNVTVRRLPTTCPVKIESGTTVALACDTDEGSAPIRSGNSFAVTNFNVIALTQNALPVGCHVTVSPDRSLTFKPAALRPVGFHTLLRVNLRADMTSNFLGEVRLYSLQMQVAKACAVFRMCAARVRSSSSLKAALPSFVFVD